MWLSPASIMHVVEGDWLGQNLSKIFRNFEVSETDKTTHRSGARYGTRMLRICEPKILLLLLFAKTFLTKYDVSQN